MRLVLKDYLVHAGYEVVGEAENGEQAVAMYEELKPDLLLIDSVMPVLDGLQALKKIISMDPSAKVIPLVALGQQDCAAECMKNGAKDFIVKPYRKESLLEAVAKALK